MKVTKFRLGYIPALDGIRGIAILMVMLFHSLPRYFRGGFLGVDVFFLLSGFLITSLLLKEFDERKRINFRNFYMRRILRLVPALLVMLLVYDLISITTLAFSEARLNLIGSAISMSYLTDWILAFQLFPTGHLGHTWSLAIEEQFYLTWPLLLLTLLHLNLSRAKIVGVVFGMTIVAWLWRVYLVASGATWARVYFALDTRLDGLLLGCTLAIFLTVFNYSKYSRYFESQNFQRARDVFITLALPLVGGYLLLRAKSHSSTMFYWFIPLTSLLTCVAILYIVLVRESLLKRILSLGILVFIGRISYALYLWHVIIFNAMRDYGHFSPITILLIGGGISFAVTIASYYLIEQPALKLKSRFRTISGGRESIPRTVVLGGDAS